MIAPQGSRRAGGGSSGLSARPRLAADSRTRAHSATGAGSQAAMGGSAPVGGTGRDDTSRVAVAGGGSSTAARTGGRKNGRNGTEGTNGRTGTDGTNGRTGTDGTNGRTGTNGRNGTASVNGAARAEARDAGLRYSSDDQPGIRRRRAGRGFTYLGPDGKTLRDRETLARIRSLAIPPAWTDVWICPWPNGHLQATGRDARRRKQHRYHPRWRERRDASKFDRMIAFAGAIGSIRERCDRDLARPGLPREKVLAAVVRLLELTLIRVGNDEYARLNQSFGLTTMRDRHARISGSQVRFRFRGKGGQAHEVGLRDRRLAGLIRRCQDLPGQELFQYVDDEGIVRDVTSDDVNEYLREIAGTEFSAKDFRTWAGTVLAYRALRAVEPAGSQREARKQVVEAIRQTAGRLGNTPAVARKSYVHPAVLDAYLDGGVGGALVEVAEEQGIPPAESTAAEEDAVVELLEQRLEADAARSRNGRRGHRG